MKRWLPLFALLVLVTPGLRCHADVPRIVYDAVALDAGGNPVSDGVHQATFRVYDVDVGGLPVWSETIDHVDVQSGRMHVELGRVNPLNIDWPKPHYISTQFEGGLESSQRTQLYRSDSRAPLSSTSSDLAYLAADSPLYEPIQSGEPVGAVPGGNWGANIGSYEGVIAYSNGVDTGSWSSLEPYGQDGYQYQCVEYVRRFYRLHLGMDTVWYGDANSYYANGPGRGLEQHPNNGTELPEPDDLLCFDYGAWGHVAIVTSATPTRVYVIQQNVSATTGFGYCTVTNGIVYGSGCQGWLHKPGNTSDTTPPVITNVQATGVGPNSAIITWTTDDYSTSRVDYGLTSSYGQSTTEDTNRVASHSVVVSGLSANTPYHYRVKSTNVASLTSYSGDYTFTTTTAMPGQPTVAVVGPTSLSVANNAGDSASGYYAFRINDGSACSNKFVQSDGTVGASPVWRTKSAWGTKTTTGLASGTSYTFDVAGASDSSGSNATSNRYGGAYVNTPTLGVANKWGSGDTAATFNGSNEYVSLPAMGTEVDLSSGFTIECWANPSALSTWYPVIQLTDSSSYGAFVNHICFDMSGTGGMRGEVYTSAGYSGGIYYGDYYVSSTLSFTTGSWHHYAMVVSSGGTLTFYKDGVADAGRSLLYMPSGGVTRGKVQIGRRDTTTSYYWHGSLDEVAIYSSALSSSRINAHRNAADAALYNTEVVKDNPVAYWRMGETSGTAAADNKGGYSPSASQTTSSCSTPSAPTDGTPTVNSTSSITWRWNDVGDETGYRVKDTGGVNKSGDLAANTIQWAESSLTPNTSYTRKIYAFNACGESSGSTGQAKYTLAKAGESTDGTGSTGNVYCTTASKNSWYTTGKTFTFSNPAGFGTGGTWKASSFQYKWNKSSTEAWSSSGTVWNSGTISLTANAGEGEYYLHVRAFNADGAANNADVLDYGPFGSDVSPPSDVTPTDEGSYTPSQDTLKASWTTSTDTGGSGILRYEYAVGTSSTTQDVRGWVSNSLSTAVTISGLSLVDGQTYYIQVRVKDNAGNFSATNPTDGILVAPGVTPIASAWVKANDTEPLSLRDKIVIAHIGDAFWLEETDRTCAIKVVSSASVTRGETVSVAGVLQFDGAQRYLLGDVVVNLGGNSVIQPLGVTCAWLGGGNYNTSTPGITGGYGQYNIGMLVRCWGKVTHSNTGDPNNKYFYLDDGSGLSSDGHDGVKVWCGTVNPPTSGTVIVTGVVTSESIGGNIVPAIMVRDDGEILIP